jgi:predicted  nucleic acid-binding Zn-ribbon protein
MGWLTDLLKEIPISAVLKEKLVAAESKHSEVEDENARLRDDLRHAKAQIKTLETRIAALTDVDDLTEVEIQILRLLADHRELKEESLCRKFQLHPQRLRLHFERLLREGYISHVETPVSTGIDDVYFLEHNGREYLSRKNLS